MRPRNIESRNELACKFVFLVILLLCAAMYQEEGVTI